MELTIEQRVAKGAEYLDVIQPGWYTSIDLDALDIGSAEDCILGQLYGHFGDAEVLLGLVDFDAINRGFDVNPSDKDWLKIRAEQVALNEAWTEVIQNLQKD